MILKSENIVFNIKVLNLLIGFPNNKYPPNKKKLPEVFIDRGGGGRLVLGGPLQILQEWNYDNPSCWAEKFPLCSEGQRQSPIQIHRQDKREVSDC